MKSNNKTKYALLGLLNEGPRSGYEIKSAMSRSTVHFWKESDSTIYPMLKLLEKEGLAISKEAFVGKKKKVIFSITNAGKKEFRQWLRGSTSIETQRNEFLLKLFFMTKPEDTLKLFKERLQMMRAIYQDYKAIEKRLKDLEDSPQKSARLKTLHYGLMHLDHEIKWLKKEIQ